MGKVKAVYPIVGSLWSVVFEPQNPVDAFFGGRVIRVRAKTEEEAARKAMKRYFRERLRRRTG